MDHYHFKPKRLTKQSPVTTASNTSRLSQDEYSNSNSSRRPSGPQSPASDLSRDHNHNSPTDSFHIELSPKLAFTSMFGAQAQPEPYSSLWLSKLFAPARATPSIPYLPGSKSSQPSIKAVRQFLHRRSIDHRHHLSPLRDQFDRFQEILRRGQDIGAMAKEKRLLKFRE
ncbi:MAG: hypothetical protein Q9198_007290 [Flavoplaca austrocitrina]